LAIADDFAVSGQQKRIVRSRLREQHAVEGIAVTARQVDPGSAMWSSPGGGSREAAEFDPFPPL
jgi:hypothetical protein